MVGQFLRRFWNFTARLDVASTLIVILLLLTLVGSFFPQRQLEIQVEVERLAQWQAGLRDRFGSLADFLLRAGIFYFFQSPVYIISIVLLGLITLLCTLFRWKAVWRSAFQRGTLQLDEAFAALPLKGRVIIANPERLADLLKKSLKKRGFRVQIEQTEQNFYLRAERNKLAFLGTLVTHLGVVLLLAGALLSGWLGWREEVIVSADHPARLLRLDNVEVGLEAFDIQRYPDGRPADYVARVILRNGMQVLGGGSLRLNQPLAYGNVNIYLLGFEQQDAGTRLSLLVRRDPGYGLVVVAGFLLLIGMAVTFNFPHSCLRGWLDRGGILWLAGSGDRRAYAFESEFTEWVAELKQDRASPSVARDPG